MFSISKSLFIVLCIFAGIGALITLIILFLISVSIIINIVDHITLIKELNEIEFDCPYEIEK